jgi:hypothetical protein
MMIFLKMGTLEVLRVVGSVCRSWQKVAKEEHELWLRIEMDIAHYDFYVPMDPIYLAMDQHSKGRLEFSICMEYLGDDEIL